MFVLCLNARRTASCTRRSHLLVGVEEELVKAVLGRRQQELLTHEQLGIAVDSAQVVQQLLLERLKRVGEGNFVEAGVYE